MKAMDLFVRAKASDRDNYSLLKRCIEFGWDGLAWSQTILGKNGVRSTVAPKKLVDLTPADMTAALGLRAMVVDPSEQLQFRQYNRLHMVVDDVADAQVLSAGNEQFKAFDILSAQPGNGQVFAYLCKTADVDIISIDFSHRVSFPLAKKLVPLPSAPPTLPFDLTACRSMQPSSEGFTSRSSMPQRWGPAAARTCSPGPRTSSSSSEGDISSYPAELTARPQCAARWT